MGKPRRYRRTARLSPPAGHALPVIEQDEGEPLEVAEAMPLGTRFLVLTALLAGCLTLLVLALYALA